LKKKEKRVYIIKWFILYILEMKKIIKDPAIKKTEGKWAKFYNKYWIIFGTFLWGPLASVYLIYKNYINLKNKEYAQKTLLIGTVSAILITLIMVNLTENFSKASFLIPIFIAYRCFNKLQSTAVENSIKEGWSLYSSWNVFGIGILFLTISIIIIFLSVLLFWR